ncbi:hypothetical protein, partial [Acinetobacter gyllenbergii]|uniref:hypothetical protein n=1 Tax=Acinetobacter gyllenbergii TaxID=134534 RepID=UPI003AF7C2DC
VIAPNVEKNSLHNKLCIFEPTYVSKSSLVANKLEKIQAVKKVKTIGIKNLIISNPKYLKLFDVEDIYESHN